MFCSAALCSFYEDFICPKKKIRSITLFCSEISSRRLIDRLFHKYECEKSTIGVWASAHICSPKPINTKALSTLLSSQLLALYS